MGLDMYLTGTRHISSYSDEIDIKLGNDVQALFPELDNMTSAWGDSSCVTSINIEAGYWRKANAIHDWLVKHIQNGVDDCGTYRFYRVQMIELRDICLKVLDDNTLAESLLPTASGFFFGSTDYDSGYLSDVSKTVTILNRCLELPESWNFKYHSSW